jgi:transposase-like protein
MKSLRGTEFGAETKALISSLYYENRVTENKIASFLNSNGLFISEGTISNILIKEQSAILTEVKKEILEAGLSCSSYNQIDDTGMKVAGKNGFATIICNEKFSVFFINLSKSRETVKSFLTSFLASLFVVLVGDDAGQFKKISERYALCWIHEERHYKKLIPILDVHRKELERLRGQIWDFYEKLKMYKLNPSEEDKKKLWDEFDEIFRQETKYDKLNDRLRLTFDKKGELLTVLDYPEIPLHNNLSENGIREIVIKIKISGGVKTKEGLNAWENNMSILATCKKLDVSFYDFMKGVFSKNITINLPEMIR